MKRILTLLMVLCLAFTAITLVSCGDNDTDTDTNTDTSSDTDSSVDTPVEKTYTITFKDEEDELVVGATISFLNPNEEVIKTLVTDAKGQVTITLTGTYYAEMTDSPEGYYYLNIAGRVELDKEQMVIVVRNNTPDGSSLKPYPVTEDTTEIKLGAKSAVYYNISGGGRNFLIENAQGLKVFYGDDEAKEADEEGKISFKMPATDASNRLVVVKFENTTDEEKTYTLSIFSDKGQQDNPHSLELDTEVTELVEKEKIAYYKWVAVKSGMVVVLSDTEGNNITLENKTTSVVSSATNGGVCEYISVNAGDEIFVCVSSLGTDNYNEVKFKVNFHEGTEADPIPLYKASMDIKLQPSQRLSFKLTTEEEKELVIRSYDIELIIDGSTITPNDDGIINGILVNGAKVIEVINLDTEYALTISINLG